MNIDRPLVERILAIIDTRGGLSAGMGSFNGRVCVEVAVCIANGQIDGTKGLIDRPNCVAPVLRDFKTAFNDFHWPSDEARGQGLRRLAIAQLGTGDSTQRLIANSRGVFDGALIRNDGFHYAQETFDTDHFLSILFMRIIEKTPAQIRLFEKDNPCTQLLDLATKIENAAKGGITEDLRNLLKSDITDFAEYRLSTFLLMRRFFANIHEACRELLHRAPYDHRVIICNLLRAAECLFAANEKYLGENLANFAEDVVQILIAMKTSGSEFLFLTE